MTTDKHHKPLHTGDQIHFTIDGRPYTGIVHALVRRDHEPAVLTLVQLFLPATEVSRDLPSPPEGEGSGVGGTHATEVSKPTTKKGTS